MINVIIINRVLLHLEFSVVQLLLILQLTIHSYKRSGLNVKKLFWHAYLKNLRSRDAEETQLAFKLQRSLGPLSLLADQ